MPVSEVLKKDRVFLFDGGASPYSSPAMRRSALEEHVANPLRNLFDVTVVDDEIDGIRSVVEKLIGESETDESFSPVAVVFFRGISGNLDDPDGIDREIINEMDHLIKLGLMKVISMNSHKLNAQWNQKIEVVDTESSVLGLVGVGNLLAAHLIPSQS